MLADDTYLALTSIEQVHENEISCYLLDTIHDKVFLFVGEKSVQLCERLVQDNHSFPVRRLVKFDDPVTDFDQKALIEKASMPAAIICDVSYDTRKIRALKQLFGKANTPLVLYNDLHTEDYRSKILALPLVVNDFLYADLGHANIVERIVFLSELSIMREGRIQDEIGEGKSPKRKIIKRAFDVVVSLLCIVLVSPMLLLIFIAIKLESRGPALFISQRAGAGYRVFNFYKFRTMQSDADQMRTHLKTINTYYAKDRDEAGKEGPFFFKIKNDPRVTKVGRFLRKTSFDELPQLFNVLKGDMSLVGNRPLPLDEGATLTIDHWADRFLAPAGMTGLWQVARNKDNMSVSERIDLDLEYVKRSSFALDMQILLKTLPAMFQKD